MDFHHWRNIQQFHMINEMLIAIDIRRIEDGDGIESTLVRHKARYYESCKMKFYNTKLQHAQKKHIILKDTDSSDTGEKFTRSPAKSEASASTSQIVCFLCEEQCCCTVKREALTIELNTRLEKCAEVLQDKKTLCKAECR